MLYRRSLHLTSFCKARTVVNIFETKVGEADIVDKENYELLKRYVAIVMANVDVNNIILPTCKDHRVGILFATIIII